MNSVSELTKSLIHQSVEFKSAKLVRVDPLAGDAGTRQYFRIFFEQCPVKTATLMTLSGAAGPYGGGPRKLTQDDTFVEVANTFQANGIRIPELYVDGRNISGQQPALLVEDVGDMALWHFAKGELDESGEKIANRIDGDCVLSLYKKAIDIMKQIQDISVDPESVIFQRKISHERYREEAQEFADYYASPRGLGASESKLLDVFVDAVCEAVIAHPRIPSHVDYMSHNLYVLPDGNLAVIDFQDCAAISPLRDLVSLINDRDIDTAIGKERNLRLLRYGEEVLNQGWDFLKLYDEYLLHWDLRVSGRFVLLSEQRGMPKYGQWIDGTVRRLGRTCSRVASAYPNGEDVVEILSRLSPSFKAGVDDPWEPDWK